jgi:hypothetical protein
MLLNLKALSRAGGLGCPKTRTAFEVREPDEWKLSSPVLRGERESNLPDLPG